MIPAESVREWAQLFLLIANVVGLLALIVLSIVLAHKDYK